VLGRPRSAPSARGRSSARIGALRRGRPTGHRRAIRATATPLRPARDASRRSRSRGSPALRAQFGRPFRLVRGRRTAATEGWSGSRGHDPSRARTDGARVGSWPLGRPRSVSSVRGCASRRIVTAPAAHPRSVRSRGNPSASCAASNGSHQRVVSLEGPRSVSRSAAARSRRIVAPGASPIRLERARVRLASDRDRSRGSPALGAQSGQPFRLVRGQQRQPPKGGQPRGATIRPELRPELRRGTLASDRGPWGVHDPSQACAGALASDRGPWGVPDPS